MASLFGQIYECQYLIRSNQSNDAIEKCSNILKDNPDYIPAILDNPGAKFSLALCGHTHGGQIVLPALGPIAAQVVDRRFVSGMTQIGERQIYTSRGLGVVGLPFRLNCPPEVTILNLRKV